MLLTGCDGPIGEAFEDGDWFYGIGSGIVMSAIAYAGVYILLRTLDDDYSSHRFLHISLAVFLWLCAIIVTAVEQGSAFTILGIIGLIIIVINILYYSKYNW